MTRLLLFILTTILTVSSVVGCDPAQVSFNLCNADSNCRTSFYIEENDGAYDVFLFLYARLLSAANTTLRGDIEVDICLNNSAYLQLWTHHMSLYRYCGHVNQYFDGLEHRCFCKPDKECKYIRPDIQQFHFSSLHLFTILMIAFDAFAVFYFMTHYKPLYKMLFIVLEKHTSPLSRLRR